MWVNEKIYPTHTGGQVLSLNPVCVPHREAVVLPAASSAAHRRPPSYIC